MTVSAVLLGVDFTADALRVVLAERDGRVLLREQWPLPALPDEEAWSWEVGGRIATLFARDGQRRAALAIAIAAPGHVDPLAGRLLDSAGQPEWANLSIVEALRRHIDAPIAAENRTIAALIGERWQGAASGAGSALYVDLRGEPSAAFEAGGRPLRGASQRAGLLPAVPRIDASRPGAHRVLPAVVQGLAAATALLDPEVTVVEAQSALLERLVPLVQTAVDDTGGRSKVVESALGDEAAALGAVAIARTLAFERAAP